jgi:cellulose synthase/poly-beta-1,6-N-acetylglucosamine synthase-like glycosyltransferase
VNPADALLALLGTPSGLTSGYLLLLTALSKKPEPPKPSSTQFRFRIIVPAHNEAAGIGETVKSLQALDYPTERFDVLVIADNCSDDTAARAKAAGAKVLVRNDDTLRGKGYALDYAFGQLTEDIDAVIVIDADTVVSKNLLSAFSSRLATGAEAVQADYRVRNPMASWRTRLMAIAFGSFHVVRSRARERLGLSAGLRGNGMCFSQKVLKQVPHEAFSIVEDVEYGIRLAQAGHRVHYVDEAHVYGEMTSTGSAARSQRKRWEGGRAGLLRAYGPALLKRAIAERSLVLADLAIDLFVPPLSTLAIGAGVGLAAASTGAALGASLPLGTTIFAFSAASLGMYVLRGWSVSETGARGLVDLLLAPGYVVWKLTLRSRPQQPRGAEWVRTAREGGE